MRRTDTEFMKRDNGRNDCVYYHFMNVKANDNDTKGMNVTKIFKVMREVRAGHRRCSQRRAQLTRSRVRDCS